MAWNDGLLPNQTTSAGHMGNHARLLAGPGTRMIALSAQIGAA